MMFDNDKSSLARHLAYSVVSRGLRKDERAKQINSKAGLPLKKLENCYLQI